MLTLVQKLVRKEGRDFFAPVLLSRLLGGHSGGSLSAGAGVLAAVVVVVSLLAWLAPDSDRPLPLELVDRVQPGAAEQVEEQAAALIEGGKEAVQSLVQNVREGVVGAGLRAAQDAFPDSSSALFPAVLPTPSNPPTPSPSSEEPSAPSEPQAPAMDSPPPATPSEPVTPPPIVEEPPPPAVDEPAPPTEESPRPAAEGPPITETPPPATEEPPPATGEPPTGTPS